jgi:hypothetical protein
MTATEAVQVGAITDQTGPLAPLGITNANTARMVVHEISDSNQKVRKVVTANGGSIG